MSMFAKTNFLAVVALTLTACGPLNDGNIASDAFSTLKGRFNGSEPISAAEAPVLTRAQANANPGGFMVVNAYNGTLVAAMAQGGTNGDRMTWLSSDGLSVTTQSGVMVATRGFPRDLMAADVDGVILALAASGGTTSRTHQILSDIDQIETLTFACVIKSEGRETIGILGSQIKTERFAETCQSNMLAFNNKYWIDDRGAIIRSLQAVAPESGYIQMDRP